MLRTAGWSAAASASTCFNIDVGLCYGVSIFIVRIGYCLQYIPYTMLWIARPVGAPREVWNVLAVIIINHA